MAGLLIENGILLTVNSSNDVFSKGYLFIQADLIIAVAEGIAPDTIRNQASEIIDAAGQIVMPGLVNSHVHLFQTLIRGLSDNRPLIPWLEEVAFPIYEKMEPEHIFTAVQMGIMENIRGGATSVIDNFTVRQSPEGYDAVFRAAKKTGIRYKMARGYSDTGYPDSLMETGDEIITSTQRLQATWCSQPDSRLRIDFSPNVIWSTTEDTLSRIAQLSQEWGIGIHIHTAEDDIENSMCLERNGVRQVAWLHQMGVLGPRTQLAHGIWINEEEIELIAESETVVVHNPVSNMFLATGICPAAAMEKAGVRVALGSDGQAVNNGQEMMDVLKWASNLQKAHTLDATVLPPEQVIQMACMNGAHAFGLPGQIGSLEPGKKADIILIDLDSSRLAMPCLSVPSLLVNLASSNDVATTIVGGKILMRDKEILVLNEDQLQREFTEIRAALINQ
jgi:5-methylthioadenosine/S-adenosylhomocysteine deaminase